MRMGRLEHRAFSGGEPRGLRGAMACGAAAVPARVVRLDLMATLVALGDMALKGGGPAHGDDPQGPVLLTRQGVTIAGQKRGAMLARHIGDFEPWRTHGRFPNSAGKARASRELSVVWSAGAATCR